MRHQPISLYYPNSPCKKGVLYHRWRECHLIGEPVCRCRAQVVAQLLNHYLAKRNKIANIIVETSGDTGPAAVAAVKSCPNVRIICLYPNERVSAVQELQLTTVDSPNVRVYRTEGNTDEQADVLKEIFMDAKFTKDHNVCYANACCYTLRPRTTPPPEENSILGVIYAVLLWADMNAATPPGSRGRSALCAGVLHQQHQLGTHHRTVVVLRVGVPAAAPGL